MVSVGASSALVSLHAAAGGASAGLVALGWRGLWLMFLASGIPTILFTVTGVLGLGQAGLSRPWMSALGWLSAAAHVLVLFTLAQRGAFAVDGIIAGLVPVTTVCADIQRDDGGVIGGEDVGAGKGPAGWVPAGPWCSWWRLGGQSDVTSVAAVRALDSSTMALRVA
jgi:hypothetical protein